MFQNEKANDNLDKDGKLVEDEAALIGRVRWSIYLNYFNQIGPYTCVLICKYIKLSVRIKLKDYIISTKRFIKF